MAYKEKIIIGNCTLYLGDFADMIGDWNNDATIITDPPYGIEYKSPSGRGRYVRGDYDVVNDDDKSFDPRPFLHFREAILFGANHYADKLPASAKWLVWDKRCGMTPNDNSDCEMAWCMHGGSARMFRHLWNGMLKDSEKDQRRVHPTQKPVALMQWVITQCEKPIDLIIDPFMGSGSTIIAAHKSGIPSVGVEIDENYFAKCVDRIQTAYSQPDMFLEL